MFKSKNQIKSYLLATAFLSLTACGGGGGGSSDSGNGSGTKSPAALVLNASQVDSSISEMSSVSLNVSTSGGSGGVTYSTDISGDDGVVNNVSASVAGNEVTVTVSELNFSGKFALTISAKDSAGINDSVVLNFDAENTSAQPILSELNAMFESKYQIANQKEEREVLVKIAKAAYYGSDDFKQSDLDLAINAAEMDINQNDRKAILDLFESKFYNQALTGVTPIDEATLNEKLLDAKAKISTYLSGINGKIYDVVIKSGDTLPEINLDGELHVIDNKASQFVGNDLFMDANTQVWNEGYQFLAGILDPSLLECNAG